MFGHSSSVLSGLEQPPGYFSGCGSRQLRSRCFAHPEYPAAFGLPNEISVGAATMNRTRADFSNFGKTVDVFAPGMMVLSTVPFQISPSGFAYLRGSSMAAAFVSGTAALMWEAKPSLTASEIRRIVTDTSWFSNGARYINIGRAVEAAANSDETVP